MSPNSNASQHGIDHPIVTNLDLNGVDPGTKARYWVRLASSGINWPIAVPVIVARGLQPGPVVGLTALVHGNELNGLRVIQRLFQELDVETLSGTLVGVLVSNMPGFLIGQRKFNDGTDPNHIMPGKPRGNDSEVYFFRLMDRVVRHFEYLIDLHTASTGRVNSYYIRADMTDMITRRMAMLHNPDIIVHNPPKDGTLRGAAEEIGIPAITLEIGDPDRFQKDMIRGGISGIQNTLKYFDMLPGDIIPAEAPPFICQGSEWMYTQQGGILEVLPQLTERVTKGQKVAILRNIFGDMIETYHAPFDGIVVGKSVDPVNQTGGRIIHLGRPHLDGDSFYTPNRN